MAARKKVTKKAPARKKAAAKKKAPAKRAPRKTDARSAPKRKVISADTVEGFMHTLARGIDIPEDRKDQREVAKRIASMAVQLTRQRMVIQDREDKAANS